MNEADATRKRPTWGPGSGYHGRGARIAGIVFTGVWLLYLIAPVADLVTGHYSVPYAAGGVALIVVFAVLYLLVPYWLVPYWPLERQRTLPYLAALAVLAVVACVLYGQVGMVGLWIFLSSASGLVVADRRWAVRCVLGCIAGYFVFGATTHLHSGDFLSNLLPVVFVGFAMIGLRRQFQLTAELTRAREEVAQLAANEERLRLARDMHDLTGQSLSVITLKSELAARLLDRLPASGERDRVRDEIEQVAAVSRQTLRDIREAVSGYRRPTLAVEIITARAALASAGIAARDDADLTLLSGTFDPEAEAALAWCLREAVTNVVRHSGAENCRISLAQHPGTMALTVRDDGEGHHGEAPPDECRVTAAIGTPTGHSSGPAAAHGSGLHGMAERLSAVGGSLELRPDARPGFCLVATVPVAPPALRVPPGPASATGRPAPEPEKRDVTSSTA